MKLTFCFCLQVPKKGSSKPCDSGQQLIQPLPTPVKTDWDELFAMWIAKKHRAISITEDDKELRKVIKKITYGRYQMPTANTNMNNFVKLTRDGLKQVREEIKAVRKQNVSPSIAIDIWSDGMLSILAVLVYYIDDEFKLNEKLAWAVPYSEVEHTGENIEKSVKKVLADLGVGQYIPDDNIDTVGEEIHASTADEGSNVVKALKSFEGAGCADHKLQNAMEHASRGDVITTLTKKCRGIVAHFRRSNKGFKKLKDIEAGIRRPNGGGNIRWGYTIDVYEWIALAEGALKQYVEPPDCARSDDGSTYSRHALTDEEHTIVHQLVSVLLPCRTLIAILEATLTPTNNLVLPYVGKMIDRLEPHKSTVSYFSGEKETIKEEDYHPKVQEFRELFQDQLKHRFEGQRIGHIEDLMVCSMLDPRFKNFDFKRATAQMRADAKKYLIGNFLNNWAPQLDPKPAPPEEEVEVVHVAKKKKVRGFLDSDSESDSDEEEERPLEEECPLAAESGGDEVDPRMEEIEKYLALPQITDAHGFDLLAWWKLHSSMFPNLAKMARCYLASPASSAGVERLFSEAGDTYSNRRKSLKEETLMQLLYIAKNCEIV